jgi:hypothetical protein
MDARGRATSAVGHRHLDRAPCVRAAQVFIQQRSVKHDDHLNG